MTTSTSLPAVAPSRPQGVKFGLMLTNQHPAETDLVARTREEIRLARTAAEFGFDSVFTGQHYLGDKVSDMQPIPWLARLTAECEGMDIGVGVHLLALQNPVETAENFAALDILSGGRLIYGAGLGYRRAEFAALGVPWSDRVARFEANLGILTRLWSGERVDADLSWCRLDGVTLSQLPVQRPRPPVWVAANSDAAVRRAARLGDSWFVNPQATLGRVREQLAVFDAERAATGLSPVQEVPVMREIFCARDRPTAMAIAEKYLAEKYKVYAAWGGEKTDRAAGSFSAPFDELASTRFILGTPEDCIAALQPWVDLGVNHFVFRTSWAGMPYPAAEQSIRLIGSEVIPGLRTHT